VLHIGRIVKLQIQRASLKVPNPDGSAHFRRFDLGPLLEVQALRVTPDGVLGVLDAEPEPTIDVHHRDHPQTKNPNGANGVSVGFTSHYAAMRQRFGDHLADGQAGENILVETEARVDEAMLSGGLAIKTGDGSLVQLEHILIAEPCVEFTRFALQLGPEDPSGPAVTEGLRFLREGTRGFYATYTGTSAVVRAGDVLFARD
jgi:hypothetical protein